MLERSVLLDHVRNQKLFWVNHTDRGDMPPCIIAFRGGEVIGTFFAPKIDKIMGLQAADLCRRGLSADQIVCVFDAHVYKAKSEEEYKAIRSTWPNGSMQAACDSNGACLTGEISDCLSVIIVDDKGSMSAETLTYEYHGSSGGVPFKWTNYIQPGDSSKFKIGGLIADNLVKIMTQPTTDHILTILAQLMGLNDLAKQRHDTDKAVMNVFRMQGFMCCGLVPTLRDMAEAGWSLSPTDRQKLLKEEQSSS